MDRVYQANAVGTPPTTVSSSGDFPTAGSQATGQKATVPGAYWFYSVTEEIRNALIAAGVTPDPAKVNQLAEAMKKFLPLNGSEAMTGTLYFSEGASSGYIAKKGTNSYLEISGADWGKGARLQLTGIDKDSGKFHLGAVGATKSSWLVGDPNGPLTWDGNSIITSAGGNFNANITFHNRGQISTWYGDDWKYISLKGKGAGGAFEAFDEDCPSNPSGFNCRARGANGEFYDLSGRKDGELYWKGNKVSVVNLNGHTFIRYDDGTQICWGRIDVEANQTTATQTFPCAFAYDDYAITITTLDDNVTSYPFNIGTRTTTGFTAWCRSTNQFGRAATWMAIGRWR